MDIKRTDITAVITTDSYGELIDAHAALAVQLDRLGEERLETTDEAANLAQKILWESGFVSLQLLRSELCEALRQTRTAPRSLSISGHLSDNP